MNRTVDIDEVSRDHYRGEVASPKSPGRAQYGTPGTLANRESTEPMSNRPGPFEKRKERQTTQMLLEVQEQLRQVKESVGDLLNESSQFMQNDARVLGSMMKSLMEQMRLQREEQTQLWERLETQNSAMANKLDDIRGARPSDGSHRMKGGQKPFQGGAEIFKPHTAVSKSDTASAPLLLGNRAAVGYVPAASDWTASIASSDDKTSLVALPVPAPGALFAAVADADFKQVCSLLEVRCDPNETRDRFVFEEKTFSPCSVLALAALSGDSEVVRALVSYKAMLTSKYGLVAGSMKMEWSGSAVYGSIPHGNIKVLTQLVSLQADPHEVSSNNGNLVWQSSYFGKVDILEYLLSLDVNCNTPGFSQDYDEVSHTPLHIAARDGHADCLEMLLSARAEVNVTNQLQISPLDDAIIQCKTACVRMLISHGAKLMLEKDVQSALRKSVTSLGMVQTVSGEHVRPMGRRTWRQKLEDRPAVDPSKMRALDLLFAFGNPVVVAAAAEGLQDQEEQVKALSTTELVSFLTTPGGSPHNIIQALFRRRDVAYFSEALGDPTSDVRTHIVTAHIHKPQYMPNGEIYEHMNVASVPCSYHDIQLQFRKREKLDPQIKRYLQKLAPQTGDESTLMSSVWLFEGLVKDLHKDLQIVRAIAKLEKHLFEHKPCQAIIQYCWRRTRGQAVAEAVFHMMFMLNFLAIGVVLRPPNPPEQGYYIRSLASLGGMIWCFECLSEVSQMFAYHQHGWTQEYVRSLGTYVDWFRLSMDFCVLFFLWTKGLEATEYALFLCTFALCAFNKWIMILYALTPFRFFGLSIMPILHTMLDIGPFFTVLMFHLFGLMHGYTSLSVPGIDIFESALIVYRLGLLGEIDPAELDGGNKDFYYVTRIFFLVVAFTVTVTLMNTFIAALGNSFSIASSKMEVLFQSHRADRVLSHMAVRQGIQKLFGKRSKSGGSQFFAHGGTLWFCMASERDLGSMSLSTAAKSQ